MYGLSNAMDNKIIENMLGTQNARRVIEGEYFRNAQKMMEESMLHADDENELDLEIFKNKERISKHWDIYSMINWG